ncbi:ABC transporter permease [Peterkaempfera bronchialis]|uniref:Transport permease protein n=1 Tax=Peterkaempfera bronchialis TaxID=2126346 RepID=A0A345SYX5_9ACTN|nr:ABC transporter permease [Peterkaempfera bronchialis]AXI78930.1 ABC transporter permease [Peterkaempfera bronchialis]
MTAFSPARTAATARRVLRQLRHDPRTIALLLIVPCLLLALLSWVFQDSPQVFDRIGAPLLGFFPFTVMFLVTSVATLRERSSGTLERLLSMPLGKLDLLLGYALAFGALAVVQAGIATGLAVGLLGLDIAGSVWALLLVAVLNAVLGTSIGLFTSAFARTEFQAVQFLPAVILPQLLLCGLFAPRGRMPSVLGAVSDVLPLSYAVDAMAQVAARTSLGGDFARDVAVIAGCIVAALALGAATLRRRTP